MKKQVTVSAPGKLMLFGEHAVVYEHPCLVTAVDQRMRATVEIFNEPDFILEAKDVQITGYQKSLRDAGKGVIPKGAKFVEIAVKNFLKKFPFHNGIKITIVSEFSSQFGFGTSSAVVVCIMKALSELNGKNLSQKDLFKLAYETVLEVQGKGSGFDVAAAVYGGTLYYVAGGKAIKPVPVKKLPLVVGYSGVKADTVTLVNGVKEKMEKHSEVVEGIFKEIETLTILATNALVENDLKTAGEFMSVNQGYLAALGVSNKKLADMIYSAREAGAYGAKLSGAGGGDCIIALVQQGKKAAVEKAITAAGGEIITVETNAEGVRVE